MIFWWPFH